VLLLRTGGPDAEAVNTFCTLGAGVPAVISERI
jgi:hypothetical protein